MFTIVKILKNWGKYKMSEEKVALITGITGQDGSYCELLLEKGYRVHGIKEEHPYSNTDRIDHLYQDPHEKTSNFLHHGVLTDSSSLINIVKQAEPVGFVTYLISCVCLF